MRPAAARAVRPQGGRSATAGREPERKTLTRCGFSAQAALGSLMLERITHRYGGPSAQASCRTPKDELTPATLQTLLTLATLQTLLTRATLETLP